MRLAIALISLCAGALAADPAALKLYQKANEQFVAKKLDESAASVQAALRLDPSLVPAWTLKAKLALAAGRLSIARSCLEQAVSLDPKAEYAQFLLGFYWYYENDFLKALPPLETAHRLNPNDSRAVFFLGLSHEGLGHTKEALAFYEQAVQLEDAQKGQTLETRLAWARLLFSLGRFGESENLVDSALALDGASRDAHYEKGRLLLERREAAAAAREGELALAARSPGTIDRQIYFLLGRAYGLAGDKDKSEFFLAKFRASGPTLRR